MVRVQAKEERTRAKRRCARGATRAGLRRGLVLSCLLLAWAFAAHAQWVDRGRAAELDAALQAAREREQSGDLPGALRAAREVTTIAQPLLARRDPASLRQLWRYHGAMAWRAGAIAEAEGAFESALAIARAMADSTDGDHRHAWLVDLVDLGRVRRGAGRLDEAARVLEQAVDGATHADGSALPQRLDALIALGGVQTDRARYRDAEHALATAQALLRGREDDPDRELSIAYAMAALYQRLGRLREAETLGAHALLLAQARVSHRPALLATFYSDLASTWLAQGRQEEAASHYRRALALQKAALGASHPALATTLSNLASCFQARGMTQEAESLYLEALAVLEHAGATDTAGYARTLGNLGVLRQETGRPAAALADHRRALGLLSARFGADSAEMVDAYNNAAHAALATGDYAGAVTGFRRSLAIAEKHFGGSSVRVSVPLMNLGTVYASEGDYPRASEHFERALALRTAAYGELHPLVAESAEYLADAAFRSGDLEVALARGRQATAIVRQRLLPPDGVVSGQMVAESRRRRAQLLLHVDVAATLAERGDEGMVHEAFEVADIARQSEVARALAQMVARLAGESAAASLARRYQALLQERERSERTLVERLADDDGERTLRRLRDIDTELLAVAQTLRRDHPRIARLMDPRPGTIGGVRPLLGAHEGLVAFSFQRDHGFAWLVTRRGVEMHRLDIGETELVALVTRIRRSIQATVEGQPAPFPLVASHRLYAGLLEPMQVALRDVSHLFVIPDAALYGLPFQLLVTRPPATGASARESIANAAWLARRVATSILPTASSLELLRGEAADTTVDRPFAGFGAPSLRGTGEATRGASVEHLYGSRGLADVAAVERFAPLPETAAELRSIAAAVGGDERFVFLGDAATETRVRSLDLRRFRILTFATHAITAGELAGYAEPGLILSPPAIPTEQDDGVLSASEVAMLDMRASLVVLSACNTAASDGRPGAVGLSGLAKAFLNAGARALLVSNWPVESLTTVRITAGAFALSAGGRHLGWAEALRQAMLRILDEGGYAAGDPAYWAPFVIIGDGGSGT